MAAKWYRFVVNDREYRTLLAEPTGADIWRMLFHDDYWRGMNLSAYSLDPIGDGASVQCSRNLIILTPNAKDTRFILVPPCGFHA